MAHKPLKIASILPQVLVLAALSALGGCYVEADAPPPPPRCGAAVWVRGHHDQYGDWHPGHYRCRGPRVVVVGSADSAAVLDRE
ncbi:MAG TPA: hypothetical protein VHW01_28055 [Polyangiaceae bacterium]|jgi:hypothetical protein|nr:hypothetical protein [Polyangiaceae bacterium]